MALRKERDDLARGALLYKNQLEEKRQLLEEEQAIAQEQIDKLDSDIRQLNAKLKDAKARQRSLLMRKDNAGSRLKAKQQVNDARLDDARSKFEAFEQRIEGLEAQVDAEDLGQEQDLDKAFAELEADDQVEEELEALRKKVAADSRSDTAES